MSAPPNVLPTSVPTISTPIAPTSSPSQNAALAAQAAQASKARAKPSLSQMLRDHTEAMDRQRKLTDQKRKDVLDSVTKVTESMVDGVNRGVARVFANQKKIEQETKLLEQNTAKFNKQAAQWNGMIADLGNALKEIGDVENWASVIESDLTEISKALEYLHGSSMT